MKTLWMIVKVEGSIYPLGIIKLKRKKNSNGDIYYFGITDRQERRVVLQEDSFMKNKSRGFLGSMLQGDQLFSSKKNAIRFCKEIIKLYSKKLLSKYK